jgi:acetolactate decarboxylase
MDRRFLLMLVALMLVAALEVACSRPSERRGATPASAAPDQPAKAARPALPVVRVWGALRSIMHEGMVGPLVSLTPQALPPHTYAVGALSELRGEITIVDDQVWLAYPGENGRIRVERGAPTAERATLLVATTVTSWRDVPLSVDIDQPELDDHLEALARSHGVDVEEPFPFLIEGGVGEVSWHVLDGRKVATTGGHEDHRKGATTGTIRDVPAVLVGFFSKHHQGLFTHMGQHSHLHALTNDHRVMGHADQVSIRKGAILKLPRVPEGRGG